MATYQELLERREVLDAEIEVARKTELAEAIKQVKTIIRQYGLTAAQCGFSSNEAADEPVSTATRAPAKPKYITPDGKKTWSGRGRAPLAFKELLDAGRKIEEFLIK